MCETQLLNISCSLSGGTTFGNLVFVTSAGDSAGDTAGATKCSLWHSLIANHMKLASIQSKCDAPHYYSQ